MTKYQREALELLINDYYNTFVNGVSEGRSISKNKVESILNEGPLSAEHALSTSLVDPPCIL